MPRPLPVEPSSRTAAAGRGLRFALLAHPTVQAVRFFTKAALAWFLVAEHFGEVMLAGLVVNLLGRVAVLGLDEAIVYARDPDARLWRSLRRAHHGLGALLALPAVGIGYAIGSAFDYPVLPTLTLALAPWIWLNNVASLPAAWLVRRQAFRDLFWIDCASILAFSAATLVVAVLGGNVWAVVAGWYAQGIVRALLSHRFAQRFEPPSADAAETGESLLGTLRYGAHVACSQSLGFLGERADAITVGLFLGRAAYGLYDWALHLSHFGLQYLASLTERVLFPRFTVHGRTGSLRTAYLDAVRFGYTLLVPAHVVLAVVVPTLVRAVFPESWHDSAPLIAVFGLAAGAMSMEMIGTTALKAAGHSRTIARLAVARVGFLALALVACTPHGAAAVAGGIACARIAGTLATGLAVRVHLSIRPLREPHAARRAALGFALWSTAFVGVHSLLSARVDGLGLVSVELVVALALWVCAVALVDRSALDGIVRRDWTAARAGGVETPRRAA